MTTIVLTMTMIPNNDNAVYNESRSVDDDDGNKHCTNDDLA